MAVREGIGVFDMSFFGKIRVEEGRDACAFLQRLCGNDVDVVPGRIVYTQMLNARGGIESDLTVTRLSETAFLIFVPIATLTRDLAWLCKHLGDDFAVITDVSQAESVLVVMGPKSRDLMRRVSPNDFSNEAFPLWHGTRNRARNGSRPGAPCDLRRGARLGTLRPCRPGHAFETLDAAGADLGLRLCGLHALDSCRIEKAYRHFGHDITDEDHVLEAGLGFSVRTKKGDFIGRDAVLAKREAGLSRRLVQFRLQDPAPLLLHNEAIVRNGEIVSIITSGNYGHALGGAIGLGYVPCQGETEEEVLASTYEIEVAAERFATEVSLTPMCDPTMARIKA
jgi:4-methylaminobutanoate oxidase (formaldehyde-forming)